MKNICFNNELMGRVCVYHEWDNYKNLFKTITYFLNSQGVIYLHLKRISKTGRMNHTVKGLVSLHGTMKGIQSLAQT